MGCEIQCRNMGIVPTWMLRFVRRLKHHGVSHFVPQNTLFILPRSFFCEIREICGGIFFVKFVKFVAAFPLPPI